MTAPLIANARMYAASPAAEAAWRGLLARVFEQAGVDFAYTPYPAPQPLEALWRRPDVGCVQMCGYPIALGLADVTPIAAPIPDAPWAQGRPVYRSDFIVRRDSPYRTLADTFGGRFGWTVAHSHSGFNAPRRHLLSYRTAARPTLYREAVGDLITARRVLDAVIEGSIDVGPLDAYWHVLIARSRPDLTEQVRVVESTAVAPVPAFVAGPAAPTEVVARLASAFASARQAAWFPPFAQELSLAGFAPMTAADYAPLLAWRDEAEAAGYPAPA